MVMPITLDINVIVTDINSGAAEAEKIGRKAFDDIYQVYKSTGAQCQALIKYVNANTEGEGEIKPTTVWNIASAPNDYELTFALPRIDISQSTWSRMLAISKASADQVRKYKAECASKGETPTIKGLAKDVGTGSNRSQTPAEKRAALKAKREAMTIDFTSWTDAELLEQMKALRIELEYRKANPRASVKSA